MSVAVGLVALGLALRLAIAATTLGTNDTSTWQRFGLEIAYFGLVQAYQVDPELVHPPLAAMWAGLSVWLSGESGRLFAFLMRLPAIAGDAAACALLWRIGMRRNHASAAKFATIWALNPLAILISGYHGNTDNVYACLCLLAFDLVSRRKPMGAGAVLAGAMNVKIIPILLLPALMAGCRSSRDIQRAIGGFLLVVVPLGLLVMLCMPILAGRLMDYGSNREDWGVLLLMKLWQYGHAANVAPTAMELWYFRAWGKWIMLAVLIAAAAWCAWRKIDPISTAAASAALFLVAAPGFSIQYLVLPALLILAASGRLGAYIGIVGGAFAGCVYYVFLSENSRLPYSKFWGLIPPVTAYLGLALWTLLLISAVVLIIPSRQKPLCD